MHAYQNMNRQRTSYAATPEISAIEPYWRELKRKVLDMPHTGLAMLHMAIAGYARYAKSSLNVGVSVPNHLR